MCKRHDDRKKLQVEVHVVVNLVQGRQRLGVGLLRERTPAVGRLVERTIFHMQIHSLLELEIKGARGLHIHCDCGCDGEMSH